MIIKVKYELLYQLLRAFKTNFKEIKMGRTKELLELQFADGEWEEIMSNLNTDISPSIYSAMEMYAIECCQATLNKASESVELVPLQGIGFIDFSKQMASKESITNPNNIILL